MRLIRARYESGAFVPSEAVPLADGVEVLLTFEELSPAAPWQEQVHFYCHRVGPLSASFEWNMPVAGMGGPHVRTCQLLASEVDGTRLLATVAPPPGVVHMELEVELPPRDQATSVDFSLRFVDFRGGEHLAGRLVTQLPAVRVAMHDLSDGPPAAWVREGTWGRLPEGVWCDSPVGDYPNNADFSLLSPLVSLGGLEGTALAFRERHCLEEGADFCLLELQADDGPWELLARFTGSSPWNSRRFDLSAYDGTRIRVRFRLVSDRSVTRDGFFFQDLLIAGIPSS